MAARVQRHLCGLPSPGSPTPSPQHVVQVKSGENEESGLPREQEDPVHTWGNLRPTEGECGVREVTPISIALVLGAGKENKVSAGSYDRKGNSPSQSPGEIS